MAPTLFDILRVSTVFSFLTLILPFVTASHWSRRHQDVALRARGDVDIHKRDTYTNARFTFYDVGLGACGQTNVASDWIVALNVDQYGSGYPGPMCFLPITIQYGGKTAQATIMDECMGCPYAGLDFSRGLFDYFASESEGVLYGNWWFNSGSGGDQTTSTWTPPSTTWEQPTTTSTPDYTPPPPTTSSTPDYTPTSSTPAYTPPPTTSTTTSTTSTTSTSSTPPTSSVGSSINLNTALPSGLAVPTGGMVPVPDASNPQNLMVINNAIIEFGVLLSTEAKTE